MRKLLQKHYEVPDFLPVVAESVQIEWVFIRSGGNGADMHVRYVYEILFILKLYARLNIFRYFS